MASVFSVACVLLLWIESAWGRGLGFLLGGPAWSKCWALHFSHPQGGWVHQMGGHTHVGGLPHVMLSVQGFYLANFLRSQSHLLYPLCHHPLISANTKHHKQIKPWQFCFKIGLLRDFENLEILAINTAIAQSKPGVSQFSPSTFFSFSY